jgi:hypothetical protein
LDRVDLRNLGISNPFDEVVPNFVFGGCVWVVDNGSVVGAGVSVGEQNSYVIINEFG